MRRVFLTLLTETFNSIRVVIPETRHPAAQKRAFRVALQEMELEFGFNEGDALAFEATERGSAREIVARDLAESTRSATTFVGALAE